MDDLKKLWAERTSEIETELATSKEVKSVDTDPFDGFSSAAEYIEAKNISEEDVIADVKARFKVSMESSEE